ncbi:bacterio-opsin activator domain-containing protein [Halohasta salina]|uniref:bacterio-opsin activator domain-containing protein n=1 Tax=Halohasta salina TaxID=2961621 RepID=UPI0020A405A7|nr:bacterio-opsin activator domain-containing protein [Halohasta salina]
MTVPRVLLVRPSGRPAGEESLPLVALPTDRGVASVPTHTTDLLQSVSGVLAAATDRPAIERGICETLVETGGYAAAWVGRFDDGTLRLSTAERVSTETVSSEALPTAVTAAAEAGSLQQCVAADREGTVAPAAVGADRLVVVPLRYGDRRYGLCGVYGDSTIGGEEGLLAAVGTTVAAGLHAAETARILTTDHVTELQITVSDPETRLARLAAAAGGRVERCGTTAAGADDCELYLATAADTDPETVGELPLVESTRVVAATDRRLTLSVTVSTVHPDDELAAFGATVTAASATPEAAEFTVEVPPEQDVRCLLEALRTRYDTVDLRRRTERDRRDRHHTEFAAAVDERLTDRQGAALRAARLNGYFEWPRPVDGSEIAATMDITRQTFHQHLRAAERKLVAAYAEGR